MFEVKIPSPAENSFAERLLALESLPRILALVKLVTPAAVREIGIVLMRPAVDVPKTGAWGEVRVKLADLKAVPKPKSVPVPFVVYPEIP